MNFKNLALTTVATPPSPSDSGTSFTVATGEGARFPQPSTDGEFLITAFPPGVNPHLGNAEILNVTARSTDTFTVERVQGDTTAKEIDSDWIIIQGLYKENIVDAGDSADDPNNALTTQAYVDAIAATSWVSGEVPSGTINGSNTAFTLSQTPTSGSEIVYLNGVRQQRGGSNDYTISGDTITFISAPLSGDVILVDYLISISSFSAPSEAFVVNELVNETPNGATTAFTVDNAFISGSEQVYRDGQLMRGGGEDYTATPGTGTITFVTAPVTNSVILVTYRKNNVVGSGDADTLDGYHANDLMLSTAQVQCAFLVHTTGQSVNHATFTVVQWNSEVYDIGGDFDTSTYIFTAPISGIYTLSSSLMIDSLGDAKRGLVQLQKNGSNFLRGSDVTLGATNDMSATISATIKLDQADQITIAAYHTHGATRNIIGINSVTWFSGALVRAI